MSRFLRGAAVWLTPPIFCLLVYWPGLFAWFHKDDFSWLSLHREVTGAGSLLHVLFSPRAQGTIRPWSERGFFLLFYRLFGADAFPWRIFVFLNACACLTLISAVTARLTGKRLAGVVAALVWTASAGLMTPMTWSSNYNQIQAALFFLAALSLRLHGMYWAEAVVFVLGLGSLEVNVVYPAIALATVFLDPHKQPARRRALQTLPLFAASIIYFLIHRAVAAPLATGAYLPHFDARIFGTFAAFWRWVTVCPWVPGLTEKQIAGLVALFTLGLVAPLFLRWNVALLGWIWFLLTLSPVLVLPEHRMFYYLTIPAIGLAIVAAAGMTVPRDPRIQIAALTPALVYMAINAPGEHRACRQLAESSSRVRTLVLGFAAAQDKHPHQAIAIDGLDQDLFSLSFPYVPFVRALDLPQLYLAPPAKEQDDDSRFRVARAPFTIPPGPMRHALTNNSVAVYYIEGMRLREITRQYASRAIPTLSDRPPARVDAGTSFTSYLLGPGWYQSQGDVRWMGKSASITLQGPGETTQWLRLNGYFSPQAFAAGPVTLSAYEDITPLGNTPINPGETTFARSFHLPRDSVGKPSITVRIEVDRTFRSPPDTRELGAAFGAFELAPTSEP